MWMKLYSHEGDRGKRERGMKMKRGERRRRDKREEERGRERKREEERGGGRNREEQRGRERKREGEEGKNVGALKALVHFLQFPSCC